MLELEEFNSSQRPAGTLFKSSLRSFPLGEFKEAMSEARGSSPTSPHEQAARGEVPAAAPAPAQPLPAALPLGEEQESAQHSLVKPAGLPMLGRPSTFAPVEPQARAQHTPHELPLSVPLYRPHGGRPLSSVLEESASPPARATAEQHLMEEARSARWQRAGIPTSCWLEQCSILSLLCH